MTKAELIVALATKQNIGKLIGNPILTDTKANGDKEYRQEHRTITNNVVVYQNTRFVVINEGEANERALYLNREPRDIAV